MLQMLSPSDEYVEFPVGEGRLCLVDKEDWPIVQKYSWRWSKHTKNPEKFGYVVTTARKPEGGYATISLHRLLMNPPKDKHVDHINGDRLDNRRSNLRLASRSQNMANMRKREKASSQYKGVCWNTRLNKWQANIRFSDGTRYLGLFENEVMAAIEYDIHAMKIHGEFAGTNFPQDLVRYLSALRENGATRG